MSIPVPGPASQPGPDPLSSLGWDARWAAVADAARTSPYDRPGRVVHVDRGRCLVRVPTESGAADGADGAVLAVVPAGVDPPTTGDWVLLDRSGALVTVLPRRTAFVRGAGRTDTRAQVLAANLDVVFVVTALSAAPNIGRIERMLALAWESGARPVVVLSKADLAPVPETEREEVAAAAPGADVVLASAVDGRGLDDLRALLPAGSTGALLGASGVGKSSLVNALAGADMMAVRGIRADGKGRHTTVTRELVPLPWGALLVDTPGLRGVQLWDAEEGLERAFAEIEELAEQCRFADCAHRTEPGCAVTAAVDDGRLSVRRLESYEKLQREQEWLARRYDARLRAEQRREWRIRAKALRDNPHR